MDDIQFCSACGNKSTLKALFCSKCGVKLELTQIDERINKNIQPINDRLFLPKVTTFLYSKASIWKRFMAYILDIIITILPIAIVFIICAILKRTLGHDSIILDVVFIGGGLVSVIWLFYYGSCHDGMPNGQSYGKKM